MGWLLIDLRIGLCVCVCVLKRMVKRHHTRLRAERQCGCGWVCCSICGGRLLCQGLPGKSEHDNAAVVGLLLDHGQTPCQAVSGSDLTHAPIMRFTGPMACSASLMCGVVLHRALLDTVVDSSACGVRGWVGDVGVLSGCGCGLVMGWLLDWIDGLVCAYVCMFVARLQYGSHHCTLLAAEEKMGVCCSIAGQTFMPRPV